MAILSPLSTLFLVQVASADYYPADPLGVNEQPGVDKSESDAFGDATFMPYLNRPDQPSVTSGFYAWPYDSLAPDTSQSGVLPRPLQGVAVPDYAPVDQRTGQPYQVGKGDDVFVGGQVISTPGFWTGVQAVNDNGVKTLQLRDSRGVVTPPIRRP